MLKITTSVVLLASDSNIGKNKVLKASIKSIMLQDYSGFEIVLVDNSKNYDEGFIDEVKHIVEESKKYIDGEIIYKYLRLPHQVSRGEARNQGVKHARGNLIIFLEDDTLYSSRNCISTVVSLAEMHRHGYGANRLWLSDKWFRNEIDNLIKLDSTEFFKLINSVAYPFEKSKRVSTSTTYGWKTFIANFGFCYKDDFMKVGGFPDFETYGYEDDQLMYKLYNLLGRPIILNELTVVHYDHQLGNPNRISLIRHFKMMNDNNHYWFYPINIIEGNKENDMNKFLEPLKCLHYDSDILLAYEDYVRLLPLDIEHEKNYKVKKSWKNNQSFQMPEFSRQISLLSSATKLDDYIKNSHADFDNLARVLEVSVKHKIIKISKSGQITPVKKFRFTEMKTSNKLSKIIPKSDFNQFPCDQDSVNRRYALFKERYPYAEYLRIAIIGDDDLLSKTIKDAYWIDAEIIEKDPEVINAIKINTNRFNIIEHDISSLSKPVGAKPIKTFITDPPYTKNGLLSFITIGLMMLEKSKYYKEFYVIINPTMIGKHLDDILAILSESGVFLNEVRLDFSQYKLPKHFPEYDRAVRFISNLGLKEKSIEYSSSSNLYMFRTQNPNISKIKKYIDNQQLYLHYPAE